MNDERLARRAASGDKAAFEAIFRRYHQDLYRYCLATLGNQQDAQDALQSTMVKAMQALPGEQREIKLRPWLYRVARNEALETIRKRRDNTELQPEHATVAWEIAEAAEARERLRRLFADLEQLPERQRSALVMRELGGLDFAEIGAAFGTTAAVARQTLYEARLGLRQMEEGRELSCESVMRVLSDADGRVTRRRDVRAHLRSCASCRAFRDGIGERRGELAAIAPLPALASAALLNGVLNSGAGLGAGASAGAASGAAAAGAGGGAGVAGVAAGGGKAVATSVIVKSAATVAVAAVVGASAADRGGVIDLPLTGGDEQTKGAVTPEGSSAGKQTGGAAADGAGQDAQAGKGANSTQTHGKGSDARGGAKQAGKHGRSAHAKPVGKSKGKSGRGKSQAKHGRPTSMPQASSHGQQTSATRKSPQANPSPGSGSSKGGSAAPAPKAAPPGKSAGSSVTPPPQRQEAPESLDSAKGGSGSKGDIGNG